MKWCEMFPSNYLSQSDVETPRVLTIAKVAMQEVRRPNGKVVKPVIHFRGDAKPMVANKTNSLVIAKLYGRDSDSWIGRSIEVYAEPNIKMGGEVTGGIRVRAPQVNAAPKPAPEQRPPLTIAQKHQMVLDGYRAARDETKVREFLTYAGKFAFAPQQQKEQADEYAAALKRLRQGTVTAHAPNGIREQIHEMAG